MVASALAAASSGPSDSLASQVRGLNAQAALKRNATGAEKNTWRKPGVFLCAS